MSKQLDKHLGVPDTRIGVLYIDDGSSECDVVRGRLQATELFRLVEARSLEELNHRLAQESFDLVLSELKPWGLAELRILEIVRIARAMTPVVIVTASGSEDWAVEAMKRGASDYIPKTPGYLERLPGRLLDAAEKSAQNAVTNRGSALSRDSARKEAEAQLRESEERFRLAARAMREAIWDWDLRKAQVWRSEGFQTLFGYQPEEVTANWDWWSERIHPDDRERILGQVPSPGSGHSQQTAFEYRFRRADGSYADVFDRGFVMFDVAGTPIRMIGSIMDLSERRRTEEMIQMHRAELAHIARLNTMGEIAAGLAHELNQPLTAIANYAHSSAQAILSKAPGRDETVFTWIEKITINTHRAAEMIRRLRSFTRKSEPHRRSCEINELIEEVVDLLEAETRLHAIRVRWKPTPTVHANVDRIQIQQVLVNLLHNAYEAMAANPPEQRRVTIVLAVGRGKIEISVKDQGEGISAENMERVFEAFFTSKPNGVGVGLAISRSIVEGHGGQLWVHPNPRQGVTFHFTLPLASS